MRKKTTPYYVGIATTYISVGLFVVLAALKLFKIITWSWWLVCAPFALPSVFCIIICLVAMWLVNRRGI